MALVKAVVGAGEEELIFAFEKIEGAGDDMEKLDGRREEWAETGAAEIDRNGLLEPELDVRLHSFHVVESFDTAHHQIGYVLHHLGGPSEAED